MEQKDPAVELLEELKRLAGETEFCRVEGSQKELEEKHARLKGLIDSNGFTRFRNNLGKMVLALPSNYRHLREFTQEWLAIVEYATRVQIINPIRDRYEHDYSATLSGLHCYSDVISSSLGDVNKALIERQREENEPILTE